MADSEDSIGLPSVEWTKLLGSAEEDKSWGSTIDSNKFHLILL